MYVHGFRVLFHSPRRGFFSPFPHGTGSLSVSQEYLALEDGPPHIQTGYHVSRPTHRAHSMCIFCVRGCHPVSRAFPDASTNTHTDSGSGLLPRSLAATGGESRLISFPRGYLDVSVPPVRLINLWIQLMIVCRNTLGFPIRKSPVITVHITLPTLIAD